MPQFDFRHAAPRDTYRVLTSLVLPRPIAWVSTVDGSGVVNLAPFSSFMGIFNPPMLAMTFGRHKGGALKDTHRNLRASQEAVVHIVDAPLLEAMHASGDAVASNISEVTRLGLATTPSTLIAPPRLTDAAVALECRLNREIELAPDSTLVLLDVLLAHVRDGIWDETHACADASRWDPVTRLGSVAGPNYGLLGERLTLPLPRLPE